MSGPSSGQVGERGVTITIGTGHPESLPACVTAMLQPAPALHRLYVRAPPPQQPALLYIFTTGSGPDIKPDKY